ncbi:unnamed protein product, partial [Meganyctiphanes norvegica]
ISIVLSAHSLRIMFSNAGGARGLGGVITLVALVFISVASSQIVEDDGTFPQTLTSYRSHNVQKRSNGAMGRLIDDIFNDDVSLSVPPSVLWLPILAIGGLIAGALLHSGGSDYGATATAAEYEYDPYARISNRGYNVANHIMRAAKKFI